ncbi:hypothetical protein [Veillonella intestinalis]|uniref:hypothetical protein n=1 Tax=Veillonella intestinalis TaxID=2941341 RepID=UPI00203F2358|nr:hypothetical protein [Veillonella intestinalis]
MVSYISINDAIAEIVDRVKLVEEINELSYLQQLQIEQFIYDIVDYCHREDFPRTLVLTVANLIATYYMEQENSVREAPLKALEENDTKFEFAVAEVDMTDLLSNQLLNKLRPKLNLYRKLVRNGKW